MTGGIGNGRLPSAALLALALLAGAGGGANASFGAPEDPPRLHVFSGTDFTDRSTFAHGGLVWAPAGDLHSRGWRVRAIADTGLYRYDAGDREITGRLASGSLLAGYQWLDARRGGKLLAGLSAVRQTTSPHDPGSPAGTRTGAALRAEAWQRLSATTVVSTSAQYETAARSHELRLAADVALGERLSLGPELVVFGEPGYRQTRIGLLAGWSPAARRLFMVGAGWAFDGDGDGPYGGVQFKSWH